MVPLTTISELAAMDVPVILEPTLTGTWRWIGTKTLTFEYDAHNNVNYKYYPLNTGLPQDSIYYDDRKSIYSVLHLPQIDELAISENNIIKVRRRKQILNDTKFEIIESTLYTSIFEYNNEGYPVKEIREYSASNIETFTYSII